MGAGFGKVYFVSNSPYCPREGGYCYNDLHDEKWLNWRATFQIPNIYPLNYGIGEKEQNQ